MTTLLHHGAVVVRTNKKCKLMQFFIVISFEKNILRSKGRFIMTFDIILPNMKLFVCTEIFVIQIHVYS